MPDSSDPISFEEVREKEYLWISKRRADANVAPPTEPEESTEGGAPPGDLIGLAISGGGIRSATYALGVLQGLASRRLLGGFDYLSTVSGGGYIGSWLSAWIRRAQDEVDECRDAGKPTSHPDGLSLVQQKLEPETDGDPSSQEFEEPRPLKHIRLYSNFLAPIPSLFSFDGWILIAIFVRNMLLNQTVFFLGILSLVCMSRSLIEVYRWFHCQTVAWYVVCVLLFASSIWAVWGTSRLLRARNDTQTKYAYLYGAVVPWVLTAFLLTLILVSKSWTDPTKTDTGGITFLTFTGCATFLLPTMLLASTALGFFGVRNRKNALSGALFGCIAGLIAGTVTCLAVFGYARMGSWLGAIHEEETLTAYVALMGVGGVPALLLLFVLTSFFHVGLSGRNLTDNEREWWSGANARLMMIALGWFVCSTITIVGPWIAMKVLHGGWISSITGTGWAATIITGLLAGQSSGTGQGKSKFEYLAKLAPIMFVVSAAMAIATLGNWIVYDFYAYYGPNVFDNSLLFANRVDVLFYDLDVPKSLKWLAALLGFSALVGAASIYIGNRVGVNAFSLQSLYRNRLVRCYLGASRCARDPHPIINLDPNDDIAIHELGRRKKSDKKEASPAGPLHLICTALNRRVSDHGRWDGPARTADSQTATSDEKGLPTNLAYLERQAESFVFSPLFCGSKSTGYRDSKTYAGGVSLGTAVALSGAAVSPNMGYHTSSLIRVLLTLFNIRLGGWYGNPRFEQESGQENPPAGWKLMISELTGKTGVDNPYLYISDGGHFENVGAYELIRRRCQYILAIDSGADPEFQDNVGRFIRQVRIDFGVRITVPVDQFIPGDDGLVKSQYVVGQIDYGASGDSEHSSKPGTIIWIRSGVTGAESSDIKTYRASHKDFPYQTTLDQFFSESQFEAYRELGNHSINSLFKNVQPTAEGYDGLKGLFDAAREKEDSPGTS